MTEYLAVFRSRSQAVDLNLKLKALKIPAKLVPTPAKAGIGCGLSVKIPQQYAERAKSYITRANYSSFYGYLKTS